MTENKNEHMQDNPFETFLDVLQSPLFPIIDHKLRRGENILPADYNIHSFIEQAFKPLDDYYSKLNLSLLVSVESVYYLQPQRNSQIPMAHFNELQMIIGLMIVAMVLENKIGQDMLFVSSQLLERMRSQLPESRLLELFRRRSGQQTKYDLNKMQEDVSKVLVIFHRYGFIQFSRDKQTFKTTPAIYRFIEPLRGLQQESDIPQRLYELIQSGYLINIDEVKSDDPDDNLVENAFFSAVYEIDTTGDLFSDKTDEERIQ
ncbi:chromosome partition protein MukE [Hafnia alvei]|nr:chromosome partition protein MukE [Hafnia alvei]